jgi:hypothetical protein
MEIEASPTYSPFSYTSFPSLRTHHPHHSFLKEQTEPAALLADFLTVHERLAFLQTHKYVPCVKFLSPLLSLAVYFDPLTYPLVFFLYLTTYLSAHASE